MGLYTLCDAFYFWDFVWLEDGIRNAAERCTDIESEDKRTLITTVPFPGVGGDGHKGDSQRV